MKKEEEIHGYKAFNKDMTCRDFQYKEGETYQEKENKVCKSGFHFCLNPLDCWSYYDLLTSVFHKVVGFGKADKCDNDSKISVKKIKIGVKVSLSEIIKASVDFVIKETTGKNLSSGDGAKIGSSGDVAKIGSSGDRAKIGSSGDGAQIGSSGDRAKIGSSGDVAQIGSSGYGAQIGSSGDRAKIGSSGDGAQIGSSGDRASIGSSGDGAKIGSSGYGAKIGSSGDRAKIGSSGDRAKIGSSGDVAQIGSSGYGAQIGSSGYGANIDLSGNNSVGMCAGHNSKIKGKIGCWVTLSEWKYDENLDKNIPICVKSGQIDGEVLKEDTWYRLKDGEFIEYKE
jgi:hypothetical protein